MADFVAAPGFLNSRSVEGSVEDNAPYQRAGCELSRRPGHRTAAEEVDVEMRNRFPAIAAVIDHEPESGILDAERAGDGAGSEEKMAEEVGVGISGVADAWDYTFWNHEDMDWGLRVDVAEGEAEVVIVDNVGRNLAGNDFLEWCHES
jgi:hypothetical protein